jgi:type I restriction-modification system DNA methylase subunit
MNTDIIELLGFENGIVDVKHAQNESLSSLKARIIKQARDLNFSIDKIYFSGEFPSVYLKKVEQFDELTLRGIQKIHKDIWNQRRVPFLYVESHTEIRVYNCYEQPINPKDPDRSITDLELIKAKRDVEKDLKELKEVFGQVSIDSGDFWRQYEYAKYLDHRKRVDKVLINNLKETRGQLINRGVPVDIVHDLLLRSLFLLYLEDRKATDKNFYSQYSQGAKSYFDILENIEATYELYGKLDRSFNGNLSPVSPAERNIVSEHHLKQIRDCFWDDKSNTEQGQMELFCWRIFDFSIISIELLSEIYEEFLSTEQGEDATSSDGAYYTPHVLVEFILNKKLPWADVDNKDYNIKVIDPTCGSGIFLVESFNRLVDRWEYQYPNRKVDFDILKKLVLDNIFGIEINPDAIKVAAFSIYLAMLDKLDPKTLWQNNTFPYLIYDPNNSDGNSQGGNLFLMSSLSDGPFLDQEYDLVVGNPPFKRGGLNQEVRRYLDNLGFAQEQVLAFIHRSAQLCSNGKIALVSASKILFNTTNGYQNFRQYLFNKLHVESIYNFSVLRKAKQKYGGNLFASAVGPACVIFYQNYLPEEATESLLYCVPKTPTKSKIVDGIAIDYTDIKYLPRDECKNPESKIWKVAMWGTRKDYSFIKSMSNYISVGECLENREKEEQWHLGVGFQTSYPSDKPDDEIKTIPYMDASNIERYYSKIENTKPISKTMFRRLGNKQAYKAPHVLIKEGQSEKKFCASFLDFDCSFTSTVFGINSATSSDELKVLTAYLNSSFSSYFLFLTASSWGVERERVKPNEIFELPGISFNLNTKTKEYLINCLDDIIRLKKDWIIRSVDISDIERKIDTLIFDSLELTYKEICLIEDTLLYSLDLFQEKEKSIAYRACTVDESLNYAKTLCNNLNDLLRYEEGLSTHSTVYGVSIKTPLNIVAIHFNTELKADAEEVAIEKSENKINNLLNEINEYTYTKFSESVYFRKLIKYAVDDTIYLIKPNEKRFWSRSAAMNDADDIMLEFAHA